MRTETAGVIVYIGLLSYLELESRAYTEDILFYPFFNNCNREGGFNDARYYLQSISLKYLRISLKASQHTTLNAFTEIEIKFNAGEMLESNAPDYLEIIFPLFLLDVAGIIWK